MRNLVITMIALAIAISLCSCGKERAGADGAPGPAGASGSTGPAGPNGDSGTEVEVLRVPATGYLATTCLQIGSLSYFVRKSTAGSANLDLYATLANCNAQTARLARLDKTDDEDYAPNANTKISIVDGAATSDVAAILWSIN